MSIMFGLILAEHFSDLKVRFDRYENGLDSQRYFLNVLAVTATVNANIIAKGRMTKVG